ncbi:hypothetical protein LCGC14_1075300 [marine sediment metagenome]|uniref:Uncharacterized protein n=1 Tax=marine sediment metagenome TaxID=412755 RepID=A0A0F9PZZ1_9ZZZZ
MAQHPTEEILNITRKFLGGEVGTPGQAPGQAPSRGTLPSQASNVARGRAFGQQGLLRRDDRRAVAPIVQPSPLVSSPETTQRPVGSLRDRFFNLPSPVDFARTPQGRALLQRVLQLRGLR